MKTLVLYSTQDGHALKIAKTITSFFDREVLRYDFLALMRARQLIFMNMALS